MALKSRVEILKQLTEAAGRQKKVQDAAQIRNLVRTGNEESLGDIGELPVTPPSPLTGQNPRTD